MEVHAHSHGHPGKKRWTHYFWEFLMLFLAVFCGFLAEYQLEHKIEKDREKQYMQSLVEDLQSDTLNITGVIELGYQQSAIMDTLIDFTNTQPISGENLKRFYMLGINSGRVVNMTFENRTSSQLKNAGGMRLIRRKQVSDSILQYWKYSETCVDVSRRLEETSNDRFDLVVRIFHNKYYIREDRPLSPLTDVKEGVQLISSEPSLMAEFSNRVYSKNMVLKNYIRNLKRTQETAARLMEQIRKGYHLD